MSLTHEVSALLRKELLLEWKQKFAIYGLLMYALSMVFVVSLGLQSSLPAQAWNVVFWVILLFVSVNAIAKSFMSETIGQFLYLYNVASARAIILSKLLYNALLMSGIALVTLLCFIFFSFKGSFGNPGLYVTTGLLGSWTFAFNMSLVSAIASRARQKTTLLAVLSFPLVVPQFLVCISASSKALLGDPWSAAASERIFCASFILIIAANSVILFPFLWRD